MTSSWTTIKRPLDLLGSILLLLLFSPVFLVVACLIKREGGDVFFGHRRVGRNGVEFPCFKFRTMVPNAQVVLDELLKRDATARDEWERTFKLKNDPRITRIGRFLRKTSLDELPQLWNVLRGDMSLIGPRPPLMREVQNYEDFAQRRLLVKPGITGLWQVSGRSDLSWEDSVRLDLYYVENWSLTGDLVILWRTVRTLLRPHGAY